MRCEPWVEVQATWPVSQIGRPGVSPAPPVPVPITSTRQMHSSPSLNPGWVSFDVTSRVQQWASGGAAATTVPEGAGRQLGPNAKQFNASEYATDTRCGPSSPSSIARLSNVARRSASRREPRVGAHPRPEFQLTATANEPMARLPWWSITPTAARSARPRLHRTAWSGLPAQPAAICSPPLPPKRPRDNHVGSGQGDGNPPASGHYRHPAARLNGYVGASDTFLDSYLNTVVRGSTPAI